MIYDKGPDPKYYLGLDPVLPLVHKMSAEQEDLAHVCFKDVTWLQVSDLSTTQSLKLG